LSSGADCCYAVVTEVDETTDTSQVNGAVANVLGDTNGLVAELNEEGADVSGASTQSVSADNCTSNAIVANSNRGITGTPCVGVTGEACEFDCEEGYTRFGEHLCNADGRFCESCSSLIAQSSSVVVSLPRYLIHT
jgi:hypothetical protein